MDAGLLDTERIVSGLSLRRVGCTGSSGRKIEVVDSAPSTNDLAWARAQEPDADGLVIFAEHQSAGRGRLGRAWESPRGAGLLCSVLLIEQPASEPTGHTGVGPRLGLLAAVACCDAIRDAAGVGVEIKWPNDLLVRGRKLGGILVESRAVAPPDDFAAGAGGLVRTAHVVGIGINCLQHRAHFPEPLRERATSLDLEAAGPIDRSTLARALLRHLDHWYADIQAHDDAEVKRAWLQRAAPLGQRVKLLHRGRRYEGHVVDLDPTAALVVQLDEGGRQVFDAATTTIVPE